jgi:hypothetical protein
MSQRIRSLPPSLNDERHDGHLFRTYMTATPPRMMLTATGYGRSDSDLRTTNIIESPFATSATAPRVTKGAGSRTKALLMAFKLLAIAEERWRKVNGSQSLPLGRAGLRVVDGVQEKPKSVAGEAKDNAARPPIHNICQFLSF